jgi:ABC-type lipoprotein release transport system permease subunit
MLKIFKMAWRNMWRNWRRTAIAMSAIVLGLILMLFMDGMIQGSDQAIFGNAVRLYGGNIQVHAPGFLEKASRLPLLPLENPDLVVETALEQPQVAAASKRINTGGLISNRGGNYPVTITAAMPSVEAPHSLIAENISRGRYLQDGDEDAILIGQGLADLLGVSIGDRVNLIGRRKDESVRQHSMNIVGIYDLGMAEAEKGTVFINLPDAQTLYNLRDQVTEVAITLESVGQEGGVVSDLSASLPGYEVDSWDTLRPELRQTMDVKAAVTGVFGIIVLLIASIGILNLMMMAVFERTREMGVLAALGMKGRHLMALFLTEGVMIGLVGAVIGCFLGWLLNVAIAQNGMDFSVAEGMGEISALMGTTLYPSLGLRDILESGISVAVIAAFASLLPAWQASRKEPADALTHV